MEFNLAQPNLSLDIIQWDFRCLQQDATSRLEAPVCRIDERMRLEVTILPKGEEENRIVELFKKQFLVQVNFENQSSLDFNLKNLFLRGLTIAAHMHGIILSVPIACSAFSNYLQSGRTYSLLAGQCLVGEIVVLAPRFFAKVMNVNTVDGESWKKIYQLFGKVQWLKNYILEKRLNLSLVKSVKDNPIVMIKNISLSQKDTQFLFKINQLIRPHSESKINFICQFNDVPTPEFLMEFHRRIRFEPRDFIKPIKKSPVFNVFPIKRNGKEVEFELTFFLQTAAQVIYAVWLDQQCLIDNMRPVPLVRTSTLVNNRDSKREIELNQTKIWIFNANEDEAIDNKKVFESEKGNQERPYQSFRLPSAYQSLDREIKNQPSFMENHSLRLIQQSQLLPADPRNYILSKGRVAQLSNENSLSSSLILSGMLLSSF